MRFTVFSVKNGVASDSNRVAGDNAHGMPGSQAAKRRAGTGNVYFDKNACLRCPIFPMGDISRGADTLLTAVFGEHPKSPRLHAIINCNTRDHRNAARPLIHVIPHRQVKRGETEVKETGTRFHKLILICTEGLAAI
ncbi:hypothetical protein DPMN_158567 [Dreissena polymorpha]|uniref:Uncharacterized protein n=1 Tax=Dreissena polymorpha TaxID=45954 RepID=A0A9D4EJ80_DREPO|nr:hypothetical protein DPMN_158567 [Dreissena polymorpha]